MPPSPPKKKEKWISERSISLYILWCCFVLIGYQFFLVLELQMIVRCFVGIKSLPSGRRASAINSWAVAQAPIFYSFNSSGCLTSTEEYSSLLLSKTVLRLLCVIVNENFFMSCIKYDSFSSLWEFARRKGQWGMQYSISHMQSTYFCGKYLYRLPRYFYFVSYGRICFKIEANNLLNGVGLNSLVFLRLGEFVVFEPGCLLSPKC